jgi:hypothetical protein
MSETIAAIYEEMIQLCREIQERNKRLDELMAQAKTIVQSNAVTAEQQREPVHHVAVADPAKMHVLTGTLPPNILKK